MFRLRHPLDNEWAALSDTAAARQSLRVWLHELGSDPHAGWDVFVAAYGDDIDRVLGVLARRAGRDELAARALLQAMLPGLESLAGRLCRRAAGWDLDATFGEVVTLAWLRIRRFPYQHCPRAIPVRILLDVKKWFWATVNQTAAARADRPLLLLDDDERLPDLADRVEDRGGDDEVLSLSTRLAFRHAVATGSLDPCAAELVWRTRALDQPVEDVAADLGRSARTVREWRHEHEQQLKDVFTRWGLAS